MTKPPAIGKNYSQVYKEVSMIPVAHRGHLANAYTHGPVGCAEAEERTEASELDGSGSQLGTAFSAPCAHVSPKAISQLCGQLRPLIRLPPGSPQMGHK